MYSIIFALFIYISSLISYSMKRRVFQYITNKQILSSEKSKCRNDYQNQNFIVLINLINAKRKRIKRNKSKYLSQSHLFQRRYSKFDKIYFILSFIYLYSFLVTNIHFLKLFYLQNQRKSKEKFVFNKIDSNNRHFSLYCEKKITYRSILESPRFLDCYSDKDTFRICLNDSQ